MDQIDRFNNRKVLINKSMKRHGLSVVSDQNLVDSYLNSPADYQSVHGTISSISLEVESNSEVSGFEVRELLQSIEASYNAEKFHKLFDSCRDSVISSIVGPFGIGEILANKDKIGGNVTTVNNARRGIYAEEKDEYRRDDYDKSKNSEGKSFAGSGKNSVGSEYTRSRLDNHKKLKDSYTGRSELASDTSPDHIVSCSENHKNGMFMLSNVKKADFATDTDNLACTKRDINRSMSDDDKMEWASKKQAGRDETNEAHFGIKHKLLKKQYEKGKAVAEIHLPGAKDKVVYYTKNTARTGALEGAKMGMQQAIGLLLSEFYQAIFDQVLDVYTNGFAANCEDDRFFSVLKARLMQVAERVGAKWKDAYEAFSAGFLSGLLSNLVTVIMNTFYTTSKRLVRIVREGFFSLLKALKLLCNPPEGMSAAEAAHEASKIIATGAIVAVGVLAEQKVVEFLSALPFSELLTPVLIGSLTGLATTFTVYMIDKIDLFGVMAREKHAFTMNALNDDLDKMLISSEKLLKEFTLQPLHPNVLA